MTNLVSAEVDVNIRVSTGLSAAIDEGHRRRRQSLRAIRLFVLQIAKKNVYTDNHMGISAGPLTSRVSTDRVCNRGGRRKSPQVNGLLSRD